MKKILTTLLITISLSGFSQAKDTIPKNNEAIISIDQLNKVLSEMRKIMTIDEMPIYQELVKQTQAIANEAIIEWRKKKKQ